MAPWVITRMNTLTHLFISSLIIIFATTLCAPLITPTNAQNNNGDDVYPHTHFVTARATQFIVDGHPLYVNGFNAYYLTYTAIDSPSLVTSLFQQASSAGFTLCRTWGFNDGSSVSSYHAMQLSPGHYDETSFRALDFVIHEARRFGIRLLVSLSNNYPNMGGKARYVEWARNDNDASGATNGEDLSSDDHFFTHPTTKAYYKSYVQYVLTRVNTLNGVAYKDDPTIFAWELMNEPRCLIDTSGDTLHAWITEMSAFVKTIDGNHMVEAGLEGFYGPSSDDKQQFNPSGMNLYTGTDYVRFGQISTVDFTTVHSYPDIWLPSSPFPQQVEFLEDWVESHIRDGSILGKPVLFAEFGYSKLNQEYTDFKRERFFAAIYKAVYASATENGPAAGALVWQVCSDDEIEGTMGTDGYGVVLHPDSVVTTLITAQSQKLSALSQ